MELHPNEPRMIRPLDNLRQRAVRRHAREDEPALLQSLAIARVNFIAMAMPLADLARAIYARDHAVAGELGGIGAQPHRAAQIRLGRALLQAFAAHPFGDEADDRL